MADFQLKVTAETQAAEKDIKRLDKTVSDATKDRKIRVDFGELNKSFKDVDKNIKEASNTIKTFYSVSKSIPGIGDRVREFEGLAKGTANLARNAPAAAAALQENAKAGSILANSFEAAGGAANTLISNLARAGFALFAVQQAVGALRSAFGGFFNETIGREIKLRETILKTQTTLASTNRVFSNGKEITDPYQKIVSLTGEVAKHIDSIRERSIALAGVTSNDVIEVFGIVASQVGQIGGGLKEAEDLAINFSAALGTFGLPLEQARQEIGSILRGDVGPDSQLALALGIGNKDIREAKTKVGGVVKFLEERLAASVAGQKIAAQGFSGVVSNIKDLSELVNQKFGAGLLDPLLGGLTRVFDFLFKIREEVFAIASGMGRGVGQLLSTNLSAIGGGSELFAQLGSGAEGFAAQLAEGVKRAFASLQADANAFVAPVRNILEELTKSFVKIGEGLGVLAKGFISINIENFKALVSVFSNLTEAVTLFSAGLGQVLRAYGQLLQVPFVQYLSQLGAQFKLLDQIGVMTAVKLGLVAATLISAWTPIVAFVQGLVARIAALLGGLVIAVGAALTRIGVMVATFAGTLSTTYPAVAALQAQLVGLATSFTTAGGAAERAGVSVAKFGGATTAASRLAGTAILNFIKFNALLLAIQVGITLLVDAFGRQQRAQEEATQSARATQALELLRTKYKDVTEASDSATKAARDYNRALVDANYQKNLDALEQVREKINQIRYELKPGIQSWREFWSALSGSEVGRFEEGSRQQLKGLLKDEQNYRDQLRAVDADRDKKNAEERITLEANKRKDLEKEIAALRRDHENELFQQRQTLAQKEVEIFRAAGELRIYQMEQANKKLIEGEEGASRAALEALNNYLSVRERGELDIEAAKKSLNVEVANLEKAAVNYRYTIEEKIAKLRNEASQNEKDAAQARADLAGNGGGASSLAPGAFGALSTVIGSVESYGGNYGAFNRGGSNNGHTARGSGVDPNLVNMTLAEIQRRQLAPNVPRDQQLHAVGKYQIIGSTLRGLLNGSYGATGVTPDMKFTPEVQEALGAALARNRVVPGSVNQTMAGLRSEWVGLQNVSDAQLLPAVRALMAGGSTPILGAGARAATPSATPAIPASGSSAGGIDASQALIEYQDAVQRVASAMERLRALQAALTNAKTVEAFDAIAKSVFQPVGLEDLQDNLSQVQLTYEALAESSGDAFDPERAKIEVDNLVKAKASTRELFQIEQYVNASTLLNAEEKKRLMTEIGVQHAAYLESLAKEKTLQQAILATQRGVDLISRFRAETKGIYEEIAATRLRNRLQAEGVAPEVIQAELNKLRIRQDLTNAQKEFTDALALEGKIRDELQKRIGGTTDAKEKARLQTELDAALERIRQLEQQLKDLPADGQKRIDAEDARAKEKVDPIQDLMGRWKAELADTKAMVASLAQTIQSELASAMSNAISGVINGTTTVKETLGQMFANIGQAFIKMATDIIAKQLVMITLQTILKALGLGFSGGSTGGLSGTNALSTTKLTPGGVFADGGIMTSRGPVPLKKYARGGIANSPQMALFGEGSTPEAFVPLPDGRRIPVSLKSQDKMNEIMGRSPVQQQSPTLNMTFQTTNIGGVEYVSRDQLEAAMAETRKAASRDGAKRGMSMTLDRLQQSPTTRRQVGLR